MSWRGRKTGSVKAAISKYGDTIIDGSPPPVKKPQIEISEKSYSKTRELLHNSRRNMSRNKEIRINDKPDLSNTKNVGKDLSSLLKESDSSNVKLQKQEIESAISSRRVKVPPSSVQKEENQQYAEVMRELENVKQELSTLKLNIAVVLEEKSQAEKQVEASSSKMLFYINSVEAIKKEIEDGNEEQVLVELARIEALKEYGDIEAQREKVANEFSSAIEHNRKKMKDILEEIDHSKELESKLTLTLSDVEDLQNKLRLVKESNTKNDSGDNLDSTSLKAVNDELEAAKKELALGREEGFQCMASMDIIRNEMKHITGEKARLKKIEEKADLTVQSLNSKILRAKAKLEALSTAAEKAKSTLSNLSLTLEQLKTEAEAARKEKEHIGEETATIKEEIQKIDSNIDSNEERLQAAVEELEEVKTSEALALENLKSLIENIMKARAKVPQQSSSITITKFEYEYLTGSAVCAQEIADKKVAAAQAWIEAIKASEKEILIQTDLDRREIRAMKLEEERKANRTQRPSSAKRMVEEELQNQRQKRGEKTLLENLQPTLSSKSMKGNGTPTPSRRANFRKAVSPATRQSNSFTMKKRPKVMPNLGILFSGKKIEKKRLNG